ncbi:MAG TPA: nucleoside monophosphate kinase [Verrucomicrobiae bacterium]|nr:nucleoside monophosphate kinase [Verrucomicrobiae bacterium]
MLPNIHIFGIQGSGKDTQASRIAATYGLVHISSGALFRSRMEIQDTVGIFLAKEIHAGRLLPDEFLYQVVEVALQRLPEGTGIVGAGIIRTLTQLEGLAPHWEKAGVAQPLGILLEVSPEVAMQRALDRRRSDDTAAALEERFSAFNTQTKPVLDRLAEQQSLIKVNGERSMDEVFADIQAALATHLPTLHGTH